MNIKEIIIASSIALLSVFGVQQAEAQHVVRRHHTVVRHGHHRGPVVRHRTYQRSRGSYGRGPGRRHYRNNRTRRHSATVIIR